MTTHTYTAKAFIDPKYDSVESVKKGRAPTLTAGDGSYWISEGYTHIGDATVTVDLLDDKTIHAQQLDGLQKQLAAHRAESQQKENAFLSAIGKLQALTYDAEAA